MSTDATLWAWKQKIKSNSKFVLVSLADRADEEHKVSANLARLVNDTCLNIKTVKSSLSKLVELELIEDSGLRSGSTNRIKIYQLIGVMGREQAYLNEPKLGPITNEGNESKLGLIKNLNEPKLGPITNEGNEPKLGLIKNLNEPKLGPITNEGNEPKLGLIKNLNEPKLGPIKSAQIRAHYPSESPGNSDTVQINRTELGLITPEVAHSSSSFLYIFNNKYTAQSFSIILKDRSFFNPLQSDVDHWITAFPDVDIVSEFSKMQSWCLSNPAKQKTRKGIKRFIHNWLDRSMDKKNNPELFPPSTKPSESTIKLKEFT